MWVAWFTHLPLVSQVEAIRHFPGLLLGLAIRAMQHGSTIAFTARCDPGAWLLGLLRSCPLVREHHSPCWRKSRRRLRTSDSQESGRV